MKKENFVGKKCIKKIVLYMLMFILITVSVLFLARILANISVGAENPKVLLESNLEKYINFKISDEDKGTLVQYKVKADVEQESEQYNPIKESELIVTLNQIDAKYPYAVKVIANTTELTNGKTENIQENYEYNAETGVVTIKTGNQNENQELINSSEPRQEAQDEYLVIAYYDTYLEEVQERELNVKTKLNVSFLEEDLIVSQENDFKANVKENIGELSSISYETSEIANGYIKSNIINGTNYDTEYTETAKVMISKKEAQEKIKVIENNTFVKVTQNQNGEETVQDSGNNGKLVYTSTKIKKENMIDLLGENGVIEILDASENLILTIDNTTEFQEDGSITITYENEPQSIIIKTSAVQNEGILEIENSKKIKSTMLEIDNIKVKTTGKLIGVNEKVEVINDEEVKTDVETFTNDYENIIDIKDSQTNVKMEISNIEWTNKQQNEVVFDIYANSNTMSDNMLKNPTIKIELPSQVEKVILGSSSVVYANGLELQTPYLETNEKGNNVIVANLVGTQTQYDENTLGLVTDVKISATIILKKDIESAAENTNLTFTNEFTLDGKSEEQTKATEIQIQSHQDESVDTQENYSLSSSLLGSTVENVEGLTLEVTPVRGDTILKDGDIVYEGEFIKYNVKVTNLSDKQIDNIKVIGTIPDGTIYGELEADYNNAFGKYEYNYDETVKEKTIEIGSLEAGESITKFYEVKVEDLQNEEISKETTSVIKTYIGETQIANYQLTNTINSAEVQLFLSSRKNVTAGMWTYALKVNSSIEGVAELQVQLPKEYILSGITNPDSYQDGDNYQVYSTEVSDDNIMTTKINLTTEEKEYIIVGNIDSLKSEKQTEESKLQLNAVAKVSVNGTKYESNENRIEYKYENVIISMTSENEGEEVEYEDEIEYKIEITSIGEKDSYSEDENVTTINLQDYLPTYVDPVSVTYQNWEVGDITYNEETEEYIVGDYEPVEKTEEIDGRSTDEEGNILPDIDLDLYIPFYKTATVTIKCTAGLVEEKTKIENNATISGEYIFAKTSNIVSHTILPYEYDEEEPDIPENPDISGDNDEKYSISGVAWVDENKDGKRQANEELLKDMTVMLVNTNNSSAIQSKQVTDNNGVYKFSGLETGNYIVVFNYDTNTYSLTEYKKSGISNTLNSDVTEKEITIQGVKTKVGLTDIISLNASVSNIDIGLVKNKVCDLKLDKYISKVQVKTSSKTSEYTYDNEQLAKVEIRSKEISGATVVVTYKIVLTNEGELPTRATKVVDYMPEGLSFSSDLNSSWTKTKNGELTNTSIANKDIGAGESIELTLILTKTMTSNSTGTFTNVAEIIEMNNSLGTKDTDSTPGNKEKTEDDYSEADLIITVSTGAFVYITMIVGVALVIGMLILLNIKFGIKKITKVSMLITITVLTIFASSSNSLGYQSWSSLPITVVWNENGTHNVNGYGFSAFKANGYNITGYCAMETFQSATGSGTERTLDSKGAKYKTSKLKTETEKSEKLSFIKANKNADVIVTLANDGKLKIGPIAIKGNPERYRYKVTDKNNNTYIKNNKTGKDEVSITNKETKDEITTFYLKIENKGYEIKNVEITGYKEIITTKTNYYTANAYYIPTSGGTSTTTRTCEIGHQHNWPITSYYNNYPIQDVMTYDRYMWTETNKKSVEKLKTLTWTIKKKNQLEDEEETGNLQIIKQDEHSKDALSGVQFRIKNSEEKYVKANSNNIEIVGTVDLTDMETTNDVSQATIFTTNRNGEINISNMLVDDYELEEISVGANDRYGIDDENISYKYTTDFGKTYTDGNGNNMSFTIVGSNSTDTGYRNIINVYNRKKYIDLSGYAWEDIINPNKNSLRDYVYTNNIDKRLQYVAVTLVDEGGNNIKGTSTDVNGEYIFENVEISKIDDGGYIKFAYNGLSYQTVDVNCIDSNGNKVENGNTAIENDYDTLTREKFNSNYAKIENNTVYKENGNVLTSSLKYNSDDYASTLNLEASGTAQYGYEGQKYPIRTSDEHEDIYCIRAKTEVAIDTDDKGYRLFGQNKTIEDILKEGQDEITNINLGLYEREQPDIALLKDLYNVKISVNGYNHVYNYGSRLNYLEKNKDDKEYQEAAFNAGVQFPSGKQDDYNEISYTRAIYTSDYDYNTDDGTDNELKVYATYKLVIKNESSNLKVRVNEIVDYYHEAYSLLNVGTNLDTNQDVINNEQIIITNDPNGNTATINLEGLKDNIIAGGSEKEIYVQFEITAEKLKEDGFLHEATEDGQTYKSSNNLENMAEISSYSVFDQNGAIYAGIDKDSNPGNADIEKVKEGKREDDTSIAPGFVIEVKNSRKITGTVFLDESVLQDTDYGTTRNGDGIYQEGTENVISGVKVGLYKSTDLTQDKDGNYKLNENVTPVGKTTYTDSAESTTSDGQFTIEGFYPGEYMIVYTWGDGTYFVDTQNTINTINVNDYKGTIYKNVDRANSNTWYTDETNRYSDAMDNYEIRKNIDTESSTTTTMDSTTPLMGFGVEIGDDLIKKIGTTSGIDKIEFAINNVDFGITERARQAVDIKKQVNSVEITLANGQTIATFKYNEKGEIEASKSITYTPSSGQQSNGTIKAEIDSELIQGATVKIQYSIKFENNSELDYDTRDYYLYGTIGTESQIIKYTPSGVYDYLDNTLKTEDTNWEIKTTDEYNEKVTEPTATENYLYQYNSATTDVEGNVIEYIGYESFEEQYYKENGDVEDIDTARTKRLADKTILLYDESNESDESINNKIKNVALGSSIDLATLNVSKLLSNSEEIDLNNDVEITKVERIGSTGRKVSPTSLYDRAESVVIVPPTGENQNYILITTMAITFLITLGTGIVFIKKKVLK